MKAKYLFLFQVCAFLVFLGRGYQFYFFGAPFRELLWDESLMAPLVENLFKIDWFDYATSKRVNHLIEIATKVASFILLLASFVSLFWNQFKFYKLKKGIVWAGLVILMCVGVCLIKSKNYDILQLFELSIQFAAPATLLAQKGASIALSKKQLVLWLKVAIALVFTSHGIFAMGLIYVPGHFIDMTISILDVTETNARFFLFVVGILDVIASIFIFIPRLSKYAFAYIIFWGTLTALARLMAGFTTDFVLSSIHHFSYLTIYRLPHGLLALATYKIYQDYRNYYINPLNNT